MTIDTTALDDAVTNVFATFPGNTWREATLRDVCDAALNAPPEGRLVEEIQGNPRILAAESPEPVKIGPGVRVRCWPGMRADYGDDTGSYVATALSAPIVRTNFGKTPTVYVEKDNGGHDFLAVTHVEVEPETVWVDVETSAPRGGIRYGAERDEFEGIYGERGEDGSVTFDFSKVLLNGGSFGIQQPSSFVRMSFGYPDREEPWKAWPWSCGPCEACLSGETYGENR